MKVLVVGGGGREHALLHALKKSSDITGLYALPGNGGSAGIARCVPQKATDIPGMVAFAQSEGIDFVVVAPDDPLVLGAVDALQAAGIPAFGPTKAAARIEGSKAFAKELMQKYGIPTADYRVFEKEDEALLYLRAQEAFPIVIKADGLALGKGVVIASSLHEAEEAVRGMMSGGKFGESGKRVVIEECLTGPEVSVLAFTDGSTVVPMVSSMDHKRAYDGDAGPNTGGMGTIAPNPYYTEAIAEVCMQKIFLPTIRGMAEEGCPFAGCLYFGLMLTPDGPKVIEYNCRFGDPEAQVVLPLLETDLFTVLRAVEGGRLAQVDVRWKKGAACCVVLASGGYPLGYETGKAISIRQGALGEDMLLYHAGTKLDTQGNLVTSGGRVLNAVAVADTLEQAVARAYEAAGAVAFEGMHMRKDIGALGLAALREE